VLIAWKPRCKPKSCLQYTQYHELQVARTPTHPAGAPQTPLTFARHASFSGPLPSTSPPRQTDQAGGSSDAAVAAPEPANPHSSGTPTGKQANDSKALEAVRQASGSTPGLQALPSLGLSRPASFTHRSSASAAGLGCLTPSRQNSFSRRLAPLVRCANDSRAGTLLHALSVRLQRYPYQHLRLLCASQCICAMTFPSNHAHMCTVT
jgi:hypothetical protein